MFKRIILSVLATVTLAGCMGHNGLTRKIVKFNLTAVEHRWNREFLFLGLNIFLVYPICGFLDLFIFNSIEFWSGSNPIDGRSPLVDLPMSEVKKMGFKDVKRAQVERICDTEAKLYLDFESGDHLTFDVVRNDMNYTVSYRGVDFYKGAIQ